MSFFSILEIFNFVLLVKLCLLKTKMNEERQTQCWLAGCAAAPTMGRHHGHVSGSHLQPLLHREREKGHSSPTCSHPPASPGGGLGARASLALALLWLLQSVSLGEVVIMIQKDLMLPTIASSWKEPDIITYSYC